MDLAKKVSNRIVRLFGGYTDDDLIAATKPTEEMLFILTDLLHNARYNNFSLEEIEALMSKARLFTRYGLKYPNIEEKQDDFCKYLKNDLWKRVYGKTFDKMN